MVFFSLRVKADAEGGLKNRAHLRPVLQGVGGGRATNKHAPGIYPRLACRYLIQRISYFAQFHFQSGQQVHWDEYQVHLRSSIEFQNWPACPRSQSSSNVCGQFPQSRSKHLGIRLSYCEDCISFSQPNYSRIALPHPAFSTNSV